LNQGIDSNPPLYYLVERVASRLATNQEIAFRIPSIAGFCCILACVFLFVRKRSGPVVALICAAVPLVTILYTTYAEEARPYAFFLAFVGIAMLCYQRASSKRWMLLMGFSLAMAQSLHQYAIFSMVPFFVAEAALAIVTRRVRVAVWLALACGCLPLLAFWRLLVELKAYYGAHLWISAALPDILRLYGALFNTSAALDRSPIAISGALGVAAVTVLALGLLARTALALRRGSLDQTESAQFSEFVLALGLLASPLILFAVMRVMHGGMTPRYVLPTILGIALAMGFVLPRLDRKTVALIAIFVFVGVADQEAGFWSSWHRSRASGQAAANHVQKFVESAGHMDLPVAASDGFDYLPTQYYSSSEWKERFLALIDVPQAVVYVGTDSIDKQLIVLGRFLPLQIYDFNSFVSSHPTFLLYSTGRGDFDWWPVRLSHEGYFLQLVKAEGSQRVYLVRAKNDQ
jgi:4-amino-4-deoxy-L-arabinose transferase-like glycosyltransferase